MILISSEASSLLEPVEKLYARLNQMQQIYLKCPDRENFRLGDGDSLARHFKSCSCCRAGIEYADEAMNSLQRNQRN